MGARFELTDRDPTWLSAFIDFPADHFATGVRFWAAVTGYAVSPARGANGEFATLVPPDGDDFLRVQQLQTGPNRIHLDVSVTDPDDAADHAVAHGATQIADSGDYVVLRSPGGLIFCLVGRVGSRRPSPVTWPGGHRSAVYQICLDLCGDTYDTEAAFWFEVLQATPQVLAARPEFTWLRGERQFALDVLLQRLDTATGPVCAHLDLGTDDRAGEVARHLALGAALLATEEFWTVLCDPTGLVYCVTDRDPATGRLVAAQATVSR